MEIRVLQYFVEIAREGNMSRAAETLHISQPTLSKQMKYLEYELGKKLFKRGSSGLTLTDEGMLLRKRAEDILDMVEKTENEFKTLDMITGGDVRIGCAESYLIKHLAHSTKRLKEKYPMLKYHLYSGDTEIVAEKLDNGLLDFAVIVEPPDLSKYNYIEIPGADVWGLLMRKDSFLAKKESISVDDLSNLELICSRQALKVDIPRWCGEKADYLNIVGTVNLTYNGSVFVKEGSCYMLTFDKLANTGSDSQLCFRPLTPTLKTKMYVIWKKYQIFTPIAQLLIDELKLELK